VQPEIRYSLLKSAPPCAGQQDIKSKNKVGRVFQEIEGWRKGLSVKSRNAGSSTVFLSSFFLSHYRTDIKPKMIFPGLVIILLQVANAYTSPPLGLILEYSQGENLSSLYFRSNSQLLLSNSNRYP
jgi:hypothetical protein